MYQNVAKFTRHSPPFWEDSPPFGPPPKGGGPFPPFAKTERKTLLMKPKTFCVFSVKPNKLWVGILPHKIGIYIKKNFGFT